MKLIDPDELRKVMYHNAFEIDSDEQKWDGGCWIRYKMFEKAIDSVPTIEAEPVRRGRWIGIDDYPYESWECDQCGCIYEEMPSWVPNFCPNCGARMEHTE